ncbi:MAG TPA: sulfite oxidase [Gemmatimonadales bacterium]|jgi:sulfite oxidase
MSSERRNFDAEGFNSAAWPDPAAPGGITETARFFSRSHAPVPHVDPDRWHLEIGGLVQRPQQLRLADLAAMRRREVTATLVCAGLRRSELLRVAPLPGELPWGPEPASTGRWSGVPLADILGIVGIDPDARYVEFTGLDQIDRDGRQFGFGGSIDIEKARTADVILATHLNDEPLAARHGAPVRAVVPGWIGARSVKWLGAITLRRDPSDNYFQTRAYRMQREIDPSKPRDVSAGTALVEVSLNAVIVDPRDGARCRPGPITIRGWAIGSGGTPLRSVEVSADDGIHWTAARISPTGRWAWSLWEANLSFQTGTHVIAVKATDADGRTQPASLDEVWNVKGYCNNAWHRIAIEVD